MFIQESEEQKTDYYQKNVPGSMFGIPSGRFMVTEGSLLEEAGKDELPELLSF